MNDEWYIGLDNGRDFDGPFTLVQLDTKISIDSSIEEKIFRKVIKPGIGPVWEDIQYSEIPRFSIEFRPKVETLIASRQSTDVTIISGPNNSGKSLLLKQLFANLGPTSCLLTCNRFSSIDVINSRTTNPDERRRAYDSIIQRQQSGNFHEDNSPRSLEQLIAGLNDEKQEKLFGIAGGLLGSAISLKQTEKNNRFSPWYVDIDGQSLKYASSGTRLLFTLLGNLLDEYFSIVLIDEPELGLSPRIQAVLAHALYDHGSRQEYFSHLKQIFVVTHSHLFLDRNVLSNNHIVEKEGNVVSCRSIESVAEFHHLQFGMLGNDLEHLFMPAAIVVVEGPCDATYLTRIFSLHIPDKRISIVVAHGDGNLVGKVNTLAEGFGGIQSSPYRPRLFVVLDAKNSTKKAQLTRQGVLAENIQVWKNNGIEYYYPKKRIAEVFRCHEGELGGVNLGSDLVKVKSTSISKFELAKQVVSIVTRQDHLDSELSEFLEKVKRATK